MNLILIWGKFLEKFENRIGSPYWRLRNYGFSGLIRYIWFDKLRFSHKFQYDFRLITNQSEFRDYLEGATSRKIDLERSNIAVDDFCKVFMETDLSEGESKKSAQDLLSTRNRLFALAGVSLATKPDVYVETGTQHGTSSAFMATLFADSISKLYSIDVLDMPKYLSSDKIQYLIYDKQVRKSIKKLSAELTAKRTLFFHDSDHSFENIAWELNFAWNSLKAIAIVVDDALGNDAFIKFAHKNQLPLILYQFDGGPAVGMIIR